MQEFPSLPNIKFEHHGEDGRDIWYYAARYLITFQDKRQEDAKNLQASVAGWLAGRECKPGSTQIRVILNRNITNISKPFCYFLL